MPQLYEGPVRFLQALSRKVQDGWAVVLFDYHQERLYVKNVVGDLQKAVMRRGRLEWESLTPREEEVVKGTDLFFIL